MKHENASEQHAIENGMGQELTSPRIAFNPTTSELTLTGPMYSLRWAAPEVLDNGVQELANDMWAVGWISWEVGWIAGLYYVDSFVYYTSDLLWQTTVRGARAPGGYYSAHYQRQITSDPG